MTSATLKAVSLLLNQMPMMRKIQQSMQGDGGCHPDRHNLSSFHKWQNFQPAYRDLGWKNREVGNRASPPSHMNKSKILQRI